MGIREHTTYTVECDVCGGVLKVRQLGHIHYHTCELQTQDGASKVARANGWTDDTTATKCPEHAGVIMDIERAHDVARREE